MVPMKQTWRGRQYTTACLSESRSNSGKVLAKLTSETEFHLNELLIVGMLIAAVDEERFTVQTTSVADRMSEIGLKCDKDAGRHQQVEFRHGTMFQCRCGQVLPGDSIYVVGREYAFDSSNAATQVVHAVAGLVLTYCR